MSTGELLTRSSVWLALSAGTLAIAIAAVAHRSHRKVFAARWAWSIGSLCFLVHVVAAFKVFHYWSHDSAYAEVARQTASFGGPAWGGGIYFNYLFAALWLGDAVWWWASPATFRQRARWVTSAWHFFFFFMVLNGAVVFVRGPMRWFGLVLCSSMVISWWRASKLTTPA